ncbi:MAG: hypothetical protein RBT11_07220 [Desulfobacterales bacterium]|jgi:hypothetical protein|nr:hypothetical protein [Desulfobacterales bacterium]
MMVVYLVAAEKISFVWLRALAEKKRFKISFILHIVLIVWSAGF